MNRRKVLVVEDDTDIREVLIDILEENGCEAVGAGNGEEALGYLKNTRSLPGLVLLDLMMPVMDGAAFREAQLNDPLLASIPVVVVSAHSDVQANAKKLKAASFIRKPVEIREVVRAVAQHSQAAPVQTPRA